MIGGRTFNDIDRSDIDWVRPQRRASIPDQRDRSDANNVVTSGTFANAQFFLEARPYKERGDFFSINPGMEWQIDDMLHFDLQVNWSAAAIFFRDSPTILVKTPLSAGYPAGMPGRAAPAGGVFVTFSNPGALVPPTITTNIDLNNPANFQWTDGRVNLDEEKRVTFTKGAAYQPGLGRRSLRAEGRRLPLTMSAAPSWAWATASPGRMRSAATIPASIPAAAEPAAVLQRPEHHRHRRPRCLPRSPPAPAPFPTCPGYGTGFCAGFPPLTYGGSLVPQIGAGVVICVPGPTGFITVNYPAFKTATNYQALSPNAAVRRHRFQHRRLTRASSRRRITAPICRPAASSTSTITSCATMPASALGRNPPADLRPGDHRGSAQCHRWRRRRPVSQHLPLRRHQAQLPGLPAVGERGLRSVGRLPGPRRDLAHHDPRQSQPHVAGREFLRPDGAVGDPGQSGPEALLSPTISTWASNTIPAARAISALPSSARALSGFTTSQTSTVPFSFLSHLSASLRHPDADPADGPHLGRGGPDGCATINLAQQVNAAGLLTVNGMEFDYVQPLDFLLDGLGLHEASASPAT